ncbi:MAG: ribosome biogenesis GTPase Der [Proteobacteria bacterium]|nr:ribosome biogenesis GTPase Der [Pseudomonadota bacterium]
MLPVVAIVGRPNVGKSTLFNVLTRTRAALVADEPGLTRDRQYGEAHIDGERFIAIDTGGIGEEETSLDNLMTQQTVQAIDEADIVLWMVDGKVGLTPPDEVIAKQLRRRKKSIILVVNKIDGADINTVKSEFYRLGFKNICLIAAAHGRGLSALLETIRPFFPPASEEESLLSDRDSIHLAIVGRPNVGKSTLVNRMLGEERVIAYDMPGTTRDSIFIPFMRREQKYTLIDTAGVRRRSRVNEGIETFSVIKTLQAIEAAHVVIVVLDAQDGVTDQDLHLLGFVLDTGRSLVIAVNKWDGLSLEQKKQMKSDLNRRLSFVDFAEIYFISALHGTGVGHLFKAVLDAYASARKTLSTPQLTRILEKAVIEHSPPLVRGRRIKLRYAHAGGQNPPIIVIHGNQTESLPQTYQRYLMSTFRKALRLVGTPIRLELKSSENPYKDKKNTLTPRQQQKRKRMMKFYKKE